ncbi:MAG: plasma-membrane proton-efflux P-type ATPase [Candidatus Bathyarchaeota archaeon]|nr:plasma-membrane proton-efflux P-type ATPase [Candidatus Bathyarchaeota archaeon]
MTNQTQNNLEQTSLLYGLDSAEVEKRLTVYGYNEVSEKKESFWMNLGKRLWGVVPWMLETTAIVTIVLGKYVQAAVIIALLFFNAGMSLWRETRAKAAMAALKQRLRIQSRVKRNGKWSIIPARELVPGDLVRVRIGDLLPADIKIVEGSIGLDQSVLTGESGVVDKSGGEKAYSGSAVKRGEATGIVDATGTKTYFGKTISLLELAKPKLHMEEVTVKVARRLGIIVLASLLIVFVYAGLTGFELAILLPLAGVLLLATVPVAMPTMFTLNMALASLSLAKQGVLITRLSAGEDAATMDVLCADKTGTITLNKLFVEEAIPVNGFSQKDILLYGALASKEANQDPIDSAFLVAAAEANIPLDVHIQLEFIPFDPKTRMTAAKIEENGEIFHVGKGSFDSICTACNVEKQTAEATLKIAEALSEKGLRVIAVAQGMDRKTLRLIGLAGIADRIREDSREILEQIDNLGVDVKMLTGDSLPVAKNIAQQVGLGKNITTMVRTQELKTKPLRYDSLIEDSHGIAQVYPEDKFSIVKTLQESQHVVGMTGDGVNDAPALAQAEVGIAMKNATDIAKDSASVVLTVDGLSGIIPMIRTSRTVYQKVYSWTLMMVTRKLHISFFIVLMLFFTHSLILSITSTLLLLFLADFATMSMSTDRVRSSLKPDKFNMRILFGTGASLGELMTVESVLFAIPGFLFFGIQDPGEIYTFGFAYLNFVGLFTILSLRERSYFWKSKPSNFLIITILTQIAIIIAISILGILELAPLGYVFVLTILCYTLLTTLLINDPIKVYLMQKLRANPAR